MNTPIVIRQLSIDTCSSVRIHSQSIEQPHSMFAMSHRATMSNFLNDFEEGQKSYVHINKTILIKL